MKNENAYLYYQLRIKLLTHMLGTGSEASIYNKHNLEKAKKEIEKANKLVGRVTKALGKYVGAEITDDKQVAELKGVVNAYCALVGRTVELPNSVEDLLDLSKELDAEFKLMTEEGKTVNATIFLRDNERRVILGTHMILGNLKENARIMTNGGDGTIFKSKTQIGETMAQNVKAVEQFMVPNSDIIRAESEADLAKIPLCGKGRYILDKIGRVLLERPMKKSDGSSCISMSELLPAGAEFGCTLRIPVTSLLVCQRNAAGEFTGFNDKALRYLLDMGKNDGLGAWRGSGGMGSFCYQLELLEDYVDATIPKGWS